MKNDATGTTRAKKSSFDASKLRLVLITTIILILALSSLLFIYFRSQLVSYAEQVQKDNAAAQVSTSDINQLKTLKQELEENVIAINRAKSIVADSRYYQYQNQIIADITAYGNKAGVSIKGFTFSEGKAADAAGAAAAGAPQTTAPAGLKTTSVSVSIKTPVDYKAIMRFIYYVQSNLTKMQISGVSLSRPDPDLGDGTVEASPITIEVYTR